MKKRPAIALAFIVFCCLSQVAQGQVVFSSLEDAWAYADQHNVSIRTAGFETAKSVYARKQSVSALLPQVSVTGSYVDNIELQTTLLPGEILGGPPGSFKTLQFGTQFAYSGGLSAQLNIINVQNWFNVAIAKQSEVLNRDSLANIRKTVYQQVATQLYSYLLMEEAAQLAATSAAIADSIYQSADNKFREGIANMSNVDLAKLNLERAQQSLISACYQAIIARNNLKALLGLSLKDSLRIDARLGKGKLSAPEATFQEDPSIRMAYLKTKINLSEYRFANSAFAPTLAVLYNYNTQRFDSKYQPFSDFMGVTAWFPSQYWSLQLNLPLFTGGSRWFQSVRNKLAYDESVMQYENMQQQSALNDENIRLNYMKAQAVLDKSRDVMQLSFDNFTHISYRYQEGIAPLDDRLSAFKDYIDYQNQYLNSLSDLLVQLYQVKIRQVAFE